MITNHTAYKYETLSKGPFFIKNCFTNVTVNSICGAVQVRYNIHHIKTYKFDTKVEDIGSKQISDNVNIRVTSYILLS